MKIFGSVSRGSDDSDSELDLLIDFPPDVSFYYLINLRLRLEDILGAEVDPVTPEGIRPELRDVISSEARFI